MQGYFSNPDATNRAIRQKKLYTGDLGYFDAEGDLWIVQRRSDLIVTGGENVYPAEVEAALKQHPSVMDACVVGISDPEWGQKVAAAIVIQAGSNLSIEALTVYCREALAGYKIPRLIRFVDTLPLTASGKIERKTVATWLNQ
ncbi:MAG TPA: p-hydroxycinnamoyl-CoA synthetase, partial [Phototrophicaceae bacterium]|jgi:O-succinylbenzoic acid--CoA ligase|nr:p-hydroxycinnamoyl-CoA synthetase [Phototrophicaceae bacterium]